MEPKPLSPIHSAEEESRDKSRFRVGQRVALKLGGCAENRTEGVIASIRSLPTLTTYEVRFDAYPGGVGIDSFYMADLLTAV